MSTAKVLKIRLSLKGRPIQSYGFNQPVIRVGRSPEADVVLDNPGISREHARIEQTPGGYYAIEDLGSANGTYVNDEPVKREYLMNNDEVRIGKFSMWVGYEEDRRAERAPKAVGADAFQGTTVLSVSEMEDMMAASRAQADPELGLVEGGPAPPGFLQRWFPALMAVGGAVAGGMLVWLFLAARGQ